MLAVLFAEGWGPGVSSQLQPGFTQTGFDNISLSFPICNSCKRQFKQHSQNIFLLYCPQLFQGYYLIHVKYTCYVDKAMRNQ